MREAVTNTVNKESRMEATKIRGRRRGKEDKTRERKRQREALRC
jgi:hypothetical protein